MKLLPPQGGRAFWLHGCPARDSAVARLVWAMSIPVLFAEIGDAVIHAVDTALLARVGTTELAAIALADIARELWVVPAVGLAEAAQIVIARRVGQRERTAVGATFTRTLVLVLLVGVALAATLKLAVGLVSGALVASPEVGDALERFLHVAAYGIPLQALDLTFSSLYVGVGRTRVLIGATAVLALTNLVFSYVLVFGELGLPRLGIAGAGLGYIGAELATLAFLTVHTLRRRDLRPYGLFRLRAASAPAVRSLARLSAPITLQGVVETLRWLAFFLILERVSTQALAWSNLVYACFVLLVIPTDAFGETAYSLVSRVIGGGRADEIGRVVRRTAWPAAMVTLPFVAAMVAFPGTVLSLFTDDRAAIDGAVGTVRVVALAILLVIPADMWLAAVFGTGDTDAAFVIEVVTTAAMLGGAFAAALILELQLPYIWLSLPFAWLIQLPLSYRWVQAGRWQRHEV